MGKIVTFGIIKIYILIHNIKSVKRDSTYMRLRAKRFGIHSMIK